MGAEASDAKDDLNEAKTKLYIGERMREWMARMN